MHDFQLNHSQSRIILDTKIKRGQTHVIRFVLVGIKLKIPQNKLDSNLK